MPTREDEEDEGNEGSSDAGVGKARGRRDSVAMRDAQERNKGEDDIEGLSAGYEMGRGEALSVRFPKR